MSKKPVNEQTVAKLSGAFKARIRALNNDERVPVSHHDGWLHAGGDAAVFDFRFQSRDGNEFRYHISAGGKALDISTNTYLGLYKGSAAVWVLDIVDDRFELQCFWRLDKGAGVKIKWDEDLVAHGFALTINKGQDQLYVIERLD